MDNNKNKDYDLLHFEDAFPDTRLVDNPEIINKNIRLQEALELYKKLGRPLTSEEMKEFERADDEQKEI